MFYILNKNDVSRCAIINLNDVSLYSAIYDTDANDGFFYGIRLILCNSEIHIWYENKINHDKDLNFLNKHFCPVNLKNLEELH